MYHGAFLIATKRVYDSPYEKDGFRVLVDRLWPRGMSKEKARLDLWMKEVAPSNELRIWFSHEPEKWGEFKQKYIQELDAKQDLLSKIRQIEKEHGAVTLLYSTKDPERNNAAVLKATLEKK